MANRVFLSLGSNMDKEKNLPAAVAMLRQFCHVIAVSSAYETAPVGLVDQANFLNAAVLIETDLDAVSLKRDVLVHIERTLERRRQTDKNAPRTIDIDLTLFNDDSLQVGSRRIPDPELLQFSHIAIPIAELAPDLRHPQTGQTLAEIAQTLLTAAAHTGGIPPKPRPDVPLD
jgi:2-amino-4-hydroxy-6-hydroxymethyldihydropteridine diphosphokinase